MAYHQRKWTVTGGQLDYNQQRNEVLFTAYQPGTYTLTADYFNTLLSCKGQATFTIVAEQPVTISGGTDEICVGTVQTFNAVPNVPVIWKVSSGSSVYTSPPMSGPFSYNFVTAGSYTVTATKNGADAKVTQSLLRYCRLLCLLRAQSQETIKYVRENLTYINLIHR
jgi:hypothetical protein